MQLTNGLRVTSLDQLLDHGGFGRVTLGFDAFNVLVYPQISSTDVDDFRLLASFGEAFTIPVTSIY